MRKYTFIGILILMAGLGAACEDQLNALSRSIKSRRKCNPGPEDS